LERYFNNVIDQKLPITKDLRSGVYVTRIKNDQLGKESKLTAEFGGFRTLLDKAVNTLNTGGVLLFGGYNLKIDQQRKIGSFDGSFEVASVNIDGKKTDATLNFIGFLIAGDENVILVQLISLSSDGIEASLFLKKIMDSLLFVI
jgi:hypothetical protein